MTKHTVVCNLDNERLWWTLTPTKYCVPAIPLTVINCEPKLFHWDLSGGIDLLHVTDVTRWLAIPTRAFGPKHVPQGSSASSRLCFRPLKGVTP